MKKLYIAIALVIVFLAAWLIDWNIRQGSAHLVEDQGSTITSRDDDLLELEIGHPRGEGPPLDERTVSDQTRRPASSPVPQQQPSGERTVIRLDDPEPAEDQEAEPGYFLYEVKKGDTLSEIALQHLGTFKRTREIMDLNNINDPRSIKPGMKLKIPKQ